MEAIYAFLRENNIELVAIKKRNKRGDRAGGPVSFKIEGLLQVFPECDVTLIAPASISAVKRRHDIAPPSSINKYQHVAFETAFAALN